VIEIVGRAGDGEVANEAAAGLLPKAVNQKRVYSILGSYQEPAILSIRFAPAAKPACLSGDGG